MSDDHSLRRTEAHFELLARETVRLKLNTHETRIAFFQQQREFLLTSLSGAGLSDQQLASELGAFDAAVNKLERLVYTLAAGHTPAQDSIQPEPSQEPPQPEPVVSAPPPQMHLEETTAKPSAAATKPISTRLVLLAAAAVATVMLVGVAVTFMLPSLVSPFFEAARGLLSGQFLSADDKTPTALRAIATDDKNKAFNRIQTNMQCSLFLKKKARGTYILPADKAINARRADILEQYSSKQAVIYIGRDDTPSKSEVETLMRKAADAFAAKLKTLSGKKEQSVYNLCVPIADKTAIMQGLEPGPPPVIKRDRRGKKLDEKYWQKKLAEIGMCHTALHDVDGVSSKTARGSQRVWTIALREFSYDPSAHDASSIPHSAFQRGAKYYKGGGWTKDGKSKEEILVFCRSMVTEIQKRNYFGAMQQIQKFSLPEEKSCSSREFPEVSEFIAPDHSAKVPAKKNGKIFSHNRQISTCIARSYSNAESALRYLVLISGGVWVSPLEVYAPVGYPPKERIPERVKKLVAKLEQRRVKFITSTGPYLDGERAYYRGDYATALRLLRPLAEQGSTADQRILALMYVLGKGVPKDTAKAEAWYIKGAEQGDGKSQSILATMYYKGHGVPKDHAKAAAWYLKAAEQGHARSQSVLGTSYYLGDIVPTDYVEAYKWLSLAVKHGRTLDKELRDKRVKPKMTPDQVAKAQQMVREWKPKK